jgi:hexosaminidase
MVVIEGEFTIAPETTILVTKETQSEGEYLADLLAPATGHRLAVKESSRRKEQDNCIVFEIDPGKKELGSEGYSLKVAADRVVVVAQKPAGVFYACQTLRQLLPAAIESREKVEDARWTIPRVEIVDVPRFSWRGHMLDTGRVFHSVELLKRYLDLMALHKLNRFHWHLTERVGWRIEIKKYPKLTAHHVFDTDLQGKKASDGSKFREFYTKDEIREIVAYAKARHIVVIPEIEMPGHSRLATECYPDMLACIDLKDRVPGHLVNRAFCAGNDRAYEFIDGVISEVAELFPGPWIHIGGDEPLMQSWAICSRCQGCIKEKKLKNVHGLYHHFTRRVEKIVADKGKRMMGWEEIGGAGLSARATIQSWHGTGPGRAAALRGQDVVMSPASHCYLDGSHGRVSIERAYSFEPVPTDLTADQAKHVLGIEAPMWMDKWRSWQYRPRPGTTGRLDTQIYPRLTALAEVAWSTKDRRDWDNFKPRLKVHGDRLQMLGVAFYRDRGIWSD